MTATLRDRAEHAARYGANLVVPATEIKQLLDERDEAINHDRQPYPAAHAYETATAALQKHRDRADRAEKQLRTVRTLADSWARPIPGLSPGVQLIALGAAALIYRALSAPAHTEGGDQR